MSQRNVPVPDSSRLSSPASAAISHTQFAVAISPFATTNSHLLFAIGSHDTHLPNASKRRPLTSIQPTRRRHPMTRIQQVLTQKHTTPQNRRFPRKRAMECKKVQPPPSRRVSRPPTVPTLRPAPARIEPEPDSPSTGCLRQPRIPLYFFSRTSHPAAGPSRLEEPLETTEKAPPPGTDLRHRPPGRRLLRMVPPGSRAASERRRSCAGPARRRRGVERSGAG